MAEPKKRLTSSRSGNRQSHDALKMQNLIACQHCKSRILPHRVCPNCGYYKGKKVIELKDDKTKKKDLAEELQQDSKQVADE